MALLRLEMKLWATSYEALLLCRVEDVPHRPSAPKGIY